jgi:hypothetical protein
MGDTTDTTATLLVDAPEISSTDDLIHAAVAIIDEALLTLLQRELVSANEVTDVLLDLRTTLLASN